MLADNFYIFIGSFGIFKFWSGGGGMKLSPYRDRKAPEGNCCLAKTRLGALAVPLLPQGSVQKVGDESHGGLLHQRITIPNFFGKIVLKSYNILRLLSIGLLQKVTPKSPQI